MLNFIKKSLLALALKTSPNKVLFTAYAHVNHNNAVILLTKLYFTKLKLDMSKPQQACA